MKYSFEEEILEPVVRWLRFKESLGVLRDANPHSIADLGCGPKIRFYEYCKRHNIFFEKYFGIDPLLDDSVITLNKRKNVSFVKAPVDTKIHMDSESVDAVVGFAFLEHIDNPGKIINDSIRILKPGGVAFFTTPSKPAKDVLEFLSYKMGLISRREIEEHKTYFDKELLNYLVTEENKKLVHLKHYYFECGLNNAFVIHKKADFRSV